ncbi:hypothetical protein VHEMI08348 [[Torrubiella] hemipterigena]|uniref:AB hydrolase-1 domain-containing protein n=1 Tax=[Torrubiella] hemipterigena TaxID=1531966 RepID=A0A0A1TD80_9HYPO|nr:hypothetical protein VHEMI08348 [[Torrubiella] hemipterigena]
MEYEYRAPEAPVAPSRSHRHTRHRSTKGSSSSRHQRQNSGPDVISNLISSLSVISQPASDHFETHHHASLSPTFPVSPSRSPEPGAYSGSFGVDYGAFNKRSTADHGSIDEFAATSPVVRPSRDRGGPSSSASLPHSPRETSSAFRSLIRESVTSSRPSSRSSQSSKNDDTHSIGNLSVEPGAAAPIPELRPRRSHDSWGKRASRTSKNILYMPSKERLRDRESDKKWTSASSVMSDYSISRGDAMLSEMPINEEPMPYEINNPQKVPTRDSSLRKSSSSHRKRSSARRSKRDSEGMDAVEEYVRSTNNSRLSHRRSESDQARRKLFDVNEHETPDRGRDSYVIGDLGEEARVARTYAEALDEEGAPSPAISSGRRRWERSMERANSRLSGRLSPSENDTLNTKRSNSRLKRLSEQLTPQSEPRDRDVSSERRLPLGYERPASADSVDDAVESYLCSDRLSQKIKHPQTGRVISFSEVGDPEGSAVFCCVGMGLTRYITAFYDELALTLKLRLITPDRPGVGNSEPYADGTATPLNWPDDVYTICQALKITKFSILAHSAGAIYALATALRMPQHIRGKIHLLAPWIPPSQMNTFGSTQTEPPSHSIPTSQRILRALPTPFLKVANSSFMSTTSSSITSSLPKTPRRNKRKVSGQSRTDGGEKTNMDLPNYQSGTDALGLSSGLENMDRMHPPQGTLNPDAAIAATGDPEADKERQATYDTRLTYAIWDLATTGANPAVDLLVCLERRHAIGFRYVDITRPVVIHHGSKDSRVPVENVKWLGKTMRRCEVRVLEEEGHGLMASAAVMGSVLMEMSKEWDDWMRVTGADGRKDKSRRGVIPK